MYRQNLKIDIPEKILKECATLYDYSEIIYKYQNCRKDRITNLSALILLNLISRRNYFNPQKQVKQNYMLVSLNMANYNLKYPKHRLSELGFTYHDVLHSIELLTELNIISVVKGYMSFKPKLDGKWYYNDNFLTKLTLNPIGRWNKAFTKNRILELTKIFFFMYDDKSNEPLAVVTTKNHKKKVIDTRILDPKFNKKLKNINDYLVKEGHPDLCYQRKFSTSDKEKDKIYFGRVWSQFHMLTKEHRHTLMEDMQLGEIDFTSCLLNIIYNFEIGKDYDGDIYNDAMSLCNIEKERHIELRPLFKVIFITMLNCERHIAIYPIQKKIKEFNLDNELNSYQIIDTISNNFEILKKYFFTKSSSFTQFIESEICIKIMNVMINDNILPLSIHDGFLFPKNEIEYYKKICDKIYKEIIINFKNKSKSDLNSDILILNKDIKVLSRYHIYNDNNKSYQTHRSNIYGISPSHLFNIKIKHDIQNTTYNFEYG